MAERLHSSPVFTALSSTEAAEPALYADLLDMWVAVIDAGGAVGFTAPADREAVARTLRGQLKRVREGRDALGVLRHDRRAVGMAFLVESGSPLRWYRDRGLLQTLRLRGDRPSPGRHPARAGRRSRRDRHVADTVTRPVGIVGLGRMGLPMCRRLTERGFTVVGTDRRSELQGSVTEAGARWAGFAAEVAAQCGVLVTMLPGPAEVSEIAGEVIAAMPPGSTWIDMSIATPAIAAEIAQAADGQDVRILDAPVGGGPPRHGPGSWWRSSAAPPNTCAPSATCSRVLPARSSTWVRRAAATPSS